MITLLILSIPFLLCVALTIVLALVSAKKNTYATEVGVDRIKFVMNGKDLFKVYANLTGGAKVDSEGKIGTTGYTVFWNPINIFLKAFFGIWWVSWLYPQREVLKFKVYDIRRYHQVSDETDLKKSVEDGDVKDTDEAYRFIERPYYMELTLGKDGSRVAVVLMIEGEVVDTVKPFISLDGKFFRRLDPSVTGQIEDWANNMEYSSILTAKTGKGEELFTACTKLNTMLVGSCGIKLTDCYIQAMRPIGKLAEATEKKAIAEIEAAVLDVNTTAKVKSITALAEAEAASYTAPIKAMIDLEVDPDDAARIIGRGRAFEKLPERITTYVEGDTGKSKKSKPGIILPGNQ